MPSSDRQGPWPGSDQAYHHIPQKTPTFVVWVLATPGVDPLPEHPATDPFAQVGPSNEIRAYLSTTQSVSESLGHRTRRPSWSTTNLGTGPASSGVVHSRRKVMPHDKFVMAWVRHSPTRHFYISRLRLSCAQVSIAGGVVITALAGDQSRCYSSHFGRVVVDAFRNPGVRVSNSVACCGLALSRWKNDGYPPPIW